MKTPGSQACLPPAGPTLVGPAGLSEPVFLVSKMELIGLSHFKRLSLCLWPFAGLFNIIKALRTST